MHSRSLSYGSVETDMQPQCITDSSVGSFHHTLSPRPVTHTYTPSLGQERGQEHGVCVTFQHPSSRPCRSGVSQVFVEEGGGGGEQLLKNPRNLFLQLGWWLYPQQSPYLKLVCKIWMPARPLITSHPHRASGRGEVGQGDWKLSLFLPVLLVLQRSKVHVHAAAKGAGRRIRLSTCKGGGVTVMVTRGPVQSLYSLCRVYGQQRKALGKPSLLITVQLCTLCMLWQPAGTSSWEGGYQNQLVGTAMDNGHCARCAIVHVTQLAPSLCLNHVNQALQMGRNKLISSMLSTKNVKISKLEIKYWLL